MNANIVRYSVDTEGIATLAIDCPGRALNVLNREALAAIYAAIARAIADPAAKAILLASDKEDFIAGADLDMVLAITDAAELKAATLELHRYLRALETCGKPVAVAINGSALGGGYELCLACHYRVAGNRPSALIGLPEVTLGLLPGGGGTQRLPRLIGIRAALPLLLEGKKLKPAEAHKAGLVHEVVAAGNEREAARAWLRGRIGQETLQPWDIKGYKLPGGPVQSPAGFETFYAGSAMTLAKTAGNYPAPHYILSCVYEGLQTDFDTGCRTEVAYFAAAAMTPEAKAMMRTLFFHMNQVNSLARRPAEVPRRKFSRVGVLGAGMMGSGVAYAQAMAGIDTVLLDTTLEAAEHGKSHTRRLLDTRVHKGYMSAETRDAALTRIYPTTRYADLDGCDLVIEAVFEDRGVKADVTRQAEAVLTPDAIFASNTSTLPIGSLAEVSIRPQRFIGLHFFSPVDKMPLVEVIVGAKTSPETLAQAMDYVRAIRKTPVVVNDSRGFYTSRVFSTYVREGLMMLAEGVAPALIENAGKLAGMPVGPLAIADEIALDLADRVNRQTAADLGAAYVRTAAEDVTETMVNVCKRIGKKVGAGFYDYPAEGPKRLWSGLMRHFPSTAQQPALEQVQRRLLYIQSIEAVRCLEEDVIASACDADVGALLGWAFPVCHGGPIGHIQQLELPRFLAACRELAVSFGPRFTPPALLEKMAAAGESFYVA
ncbi:MAG: enoyl-CoA hydratase/isomerase family protein [Zoogloeaceae bacterium]|jgi:3-hydroxyacyl-CoA dehydrogenase/enoyl-CoA hydratase/3-hydroxybutyryl-CoA epimerase|nr:enoyl-CoA hydratase/isomerase family protein [Zoogloeaceae bacterium]